MSNALIKVALPLSALLTFGVTAAAQQQQQPQPRSQAPSSSQAGQRADLQSFTGCVERDPSARGQVGASQQTGAAQTVLLKKASTATTQSTRVGDDAQRTAQSSSSASQSSGSRAEADDRRGGAMGNDTTYRLVAPMQSSFALATFVGQQVEVRGTITPQPVDSDSVGQASRPTDRQGGQGQPTTVEPPSTDFDDIYKALTVTSIRKIADSCEGSK